MKFRVFKDRPSARFAHIAVSGVPSPTLQKASESVVPSLLSQQNASAIRCRSSVSNQSTIGPDGKQYSRIPVDGITLARFPFVGFSGFNRFTKHFITATRSGG
jgi:hypothetical protein